jgi:hypothetical protein
MGAAKTTCVDISTIKKIRVSIHNQTESSTGEASAYACRSCRDSGETLKTVSIAAPHPAFIFRAVYGRHPFIMIIKCCHERELRFPAPHIFDIHITQTPECETKFLDTLGVDGHHE